LWEESKGKAFVRISQEMNYCSSQRERLAEDTDIKVIPIHSGLGNLSVLTSEPSVSLELE
jgi:hypothetical protein